MQRKECEGECENAMLQGIFGAYDMHRPWSPFAKDGHAEVTIVLTRLRHGRSGPPLAQCPPAVETGSR